MLPLGASAVTKAEADSAYVRGEYQQAITDYEALLKQGGSAELYYNLGSTTSGPCCSHLAIAISVSICR